MTFRCTILGRKSQKILSGMQQNGIDLQKKLEKKAMKILNCIIGMSTVKILKIQTPEKLP